MKKNTSFTLIELLVVIVIIGVLAGVIIMTTTSSISKANITKLIAFEASVTNSLSANMLSRWKLDEITGGPTTYHILDAWGNSVGTLGNGGCSQGSATCPTFISESSNQCISGGCMSFDGLDDYINIPHNTSFKPTNKLTVSAWAYMDDWGAINDRRILSCTESGGYNITINTTSQYPMVYVNGSYRSPAFSPTVPSSGWHLFVFTFDGRYTKSYFDGQYKNQSDSGASYSITYAANNSLQIGAEAGSGSAPVTGNYFQGKIDDIRIYDGTISSSQIKQNYIAGLNSLLSKGQISKEEYNQKIENLGSAF